MYKTEGGLNENQEIFQHNSNEYSDLGINSILWIGKQNGGTGKQVFHAGRKW